MTTLLPPVYAYFTDTNGNPLSGGKIFTYAAGTTTQLASYTDYSGNTANPNPVILDAAGTAQIWLGNSLYKIVVQDANGVTLKTVDNVGDIQNVTENSAFGAATDIPSSILVDLGTVASHFANITGTTTIEGFGTNATLDNPVYLIKFDNSLTLTSGPNLILPGSSNIVTAPSDHAFVEYIGSGVWRMFSYMRSDGTTLRFGNTAVNGNLTVSGTVTTNGGVLTINGTSTSQATLALYEDTDNGTNKITVTVPSTIATDKVVTFQDATGTLALTDDLHARFIQSRGAASAPSIVFDSTVINGTYSRYIIEVIDAVPVIDAVEAQIRMSTDDGSTYLSSYSYFYIMGSSNGAGQTNSFAASSTTIAISAVNTAGSFVGNAAGESYNAKITLNNPNGGRFKSVRILADYTGDLGYAVLFDGTGKTNVNNAINNIQFRFSSGNIASGTFRLYGIK